MNWGYVYILLMLSTFLFVLYAGDREARLAVSTLFVGSALTLLAVWLSGQYFDSVDSLLILFDFAILAVFFGHALFSRKYWTICLPALQLNVCFAHAAKYVAPEILPKAYSAGQGFWAYPMILIIVAAACWENANRRQSARRSRRVAGQ